MQPGTPTPRAARASLVRQLRAIRRHLGTATGRLDDALLTACGDERADEAVARLDAALDVAWTHATAALAGLSTPTMDDAITEWAEPEVAA